MLRLGWLSVMVKLRVRSMVWFATGVVLTLLATLLVTQAWRAEAAPGDRDSTFVPVTPCRLFDMRAAELPADGKKTPLGPGEDNVHTQQVTGSVGNCVGIPIDATAVSMNVTIVNPTAQYNLRVFPANADTPTVSNLNWLPGQSPTPNKVDVKLSSGGKINLYNHAGSVNVLADVVGYYTNSTLSEIAARLAELEGAQPFAVAARDEIEGVSNVPEVVVSVDVTAPTDGHVAVNSTTNAEWNTPGQFVQCSIRVVGFIVAIDDNYLQRWAPPDIGGGSSQMAGTRVFDIARETTVTYSLVCNHTGMSAGNAQMKDTTLTAIFTPSR